MYTIEKADLNLQISVSPDSSIWFKLKYRDFEKEATIAARDEYGRWSDLFRILQKYDEKLVFNPGVQYDNKDLLIVLPEDVFVTLKADVENTRDSYATTTATYKYKLDRSDFGFSEFDVNPLIRAIWKTECDKKGVPPEPLICKSLMFNLNRTGEIVEFAKQHKNMYPAQPSWREEARAERERAIADGTAPGWADVPANILIPHIMELLQPELKKAEERHLHRLACEKEKQELLEGVQWSYTETMTYDEGGRTKTYHHTIQIGNKVFKFKERNVFDFGVVINPEYEVVPGHKGGIVQSDNDTGELWWQILDPNGGWKPGRPLDSVEERAWKIVAKCGPFAHSGIRM